MLHGSIRPAAPTRPVLPAFAAAKANVPVSTVAAAAASPVLSNNVISPPWMNDSPIHQVLVFLLPAPGTTAIALRKGLPGEPGAERRGRPASALRRTCTGLRMRPRRSGRAGAGENGRVKTSAAADLVRDRLGAVIFQRVAGPQGPQRRRLIGAPGERWFAEDRPIRAVHGDSSMFIGGITALLL